MKKKPFGCEIDPVLEFTTIKIFIVVFYYDSCCVWHNVLHVVINKYGWNIFLRLLIFFHYIFSE